jgi:hypothetical protein
VALAKQELSQARSAIRKAGSMFGPPGRSISRTLRERPLWVAPVAAILLMLLAGFWVRRQMEDAMRAQCRAELTTLLQADVEALGLWMRMQEDNAETIAADDEVASHVRDLVAYAQMGNTSVAALLQSPLQAQLKDQIDSWLEGRSYLGYVVFDTQGLVLAAEPNLLVGQQGLLTGQDQVFKDLLAGKARVSHPLASRILLPDETGQPSVGVPVMFVAAPVAGRDGKSVAVIALRINPAQEFSQIIGVAQPGESGETYAFDSRGVFLSSSRFEDQLKQIALLPDLANARSVLTLQARDPGVDLTVGGRASQTRDKQPLTVMAADAIGRKPSIRKPGADVDGYRDYRGVNVVGAWAWLPEY